MLLGEISKEKNKYSAYYFAHNGNREGTKKKYTIDVIRHGEYQHEDKKKKKRKKETVYVDLSYVIVQYDNPIVYICTLY